MTSFPRPTVHTIPRHLIPPSARCGIVVAVTIVAVSCCSRAPEPPVVEVPAAERAAERRQMVRTQIAERGVTDARVLAALEKVPRHLFVPEEVRPRAYDDSPLRIGHDQTISQPYIVAFMTEALGLQGSEVVLEVGTGSGYQAAVLGEICRQVYTIEIVEPLARRAEATLEQLGYGNVEVRVGDGYRGWPEHAPFDAIMVTAAPKQVPEPLVEQIKVGGRMILPVGDHDQELVLIEKTESGTTSRKILPVRFVPMTGQAREK